MPRWPVPALLIPAAAVLVGGNSGGRAWLAVAVILVQIALVGSWIVLFRASLDASALVVIAVGVADIVLLRTDHATGGSIVGVIGLSVVAALLHQLALRHREAVTERVAANLSAIVAASALALLLPLRELAGGRSVIYVSLLSVAAALVLTRLVGRHVAGAIVGLVVAAAVSLSFGLPTGGLDAGEALGAGLAAAVAGLLVDRALQRVVSPRELLASAAVSALLPLALAAPIAYLAGRIITSSWG
jgi:hypothetical protein